MYMFILICVHVLTGEKLRCSITSEAVNNGGTETHGKVGPDWLGSTAMVLLESWFRT